MYDPFHVQISCDAYSTSKQLLKALWIEISYTKFKFENKNASGKLSKNFLAYQNSIGFRSPTNFGDLASLLGPFLDLFLACKNSFYSTHNVSNVKESISEHIMVHKGNDSTSSTSTGQNKLKKGSEKSGFSIIPPVSFLNKILAGITFVLLKMSSAFSGIWSAIFL